MFQDSGKKIFLVRSCCSMFFSLIIQSLLPYRTGTGRKANRKGGTGINTVIPGTGRASGTGTGTGTNRKIPADA